MTSVSIGQAVHNTQNALHNISANLAQLYEDVLYIYDYFHYIDSLDEDEINTDEQVPFPSVLQYGIRFENVSSHTLIIKIKFYKMYLFLYYLMKR